MVSEREVALRSVVPRFRVLHADVVGLVLFFQGEVGKRNIVWGTVFRGCGVGLYSCRHGEARALSEVIKQK